MSFFGGGNGDKDDKSKISNGRIAIWVTVAGVGVYLIGSGVIGIITGGS
ncbi:hypothetical protein GCM10009808_14460 [Microbacterium sediminicola]|uniref:Uncharacterized protein n=1 Tax=Microbacterium sediminicola TaxID=415210 RepID=A0ABN2I3W0_9MICO